MSELPSAAEIRRRRAHVATARRVGIEPVAEWAAVVALADRVESLESVLGALLEDTQHADHRCGDPDCIVDIARRVLAETEDPA